ncbi:hypothetical protein B0H21DRAFT_727465 [Amylocystis lapponica]|nr:hypothetical protein B0H21DRAFT_727465 [Amylocystis lapponica]
MQSTRAGPSQQPAPRSIQGSRPGLLDPTQPERLLRVPGSTLLFAFFHPLTATSGHDVPNVRKLSTHEELYRPKRVVIETPPNGGSFWRFVPRAQWAQGVENEGAWPRVIEICGECIYCSEDQWDIHKLDPDYDCFVDASPNMTVISKKKNKGRASFESVPLDPRHVNAPQTPPRAGKRPRSSPHPEQATPAPKRFRSHITISDDSTEIEDEEEDEVEEIVVAGRRRIQRTYTAPNIRTTLSFDQRWRRRQAASDDGRRMKREKGAATSKSFEGPGPDQEMIDLTMESDESSHRGEQEHAARPASPVKRKGAPAPRSQSTDGHRNHSHDGVGHPNKRMRTMSPTAVRHVLQEKHAEREKRRMAHFKERLHNRNEALQQKFIDTLMKNVANGLRSGDASTPATEPPEMETEMETEMNEEEALHQAAIEESRRKLAELEKDRPLWEESARRRQAEAQAAEDARRAQAEEEQRREAEARRRKAADEWRRREAADARARQEQQRRDAHARAEQEQARRQQQRVRWAYGPWTPSRALERYKLLCEAFDTAKFTAADPVSFEVVPWPVLHSPAALKVEDIDWGAVEAFFRAVKVLMRSQDYKAFVEKSHKRFHPDRWRARGVLKSIEDDQLRDCLDVAANTVAQALTPLWREVKGG